jgi:UrcA family protein
MKKLSVASVIAVVLSSIAVAPAAAQDTQVAVHYGDLDLTTTAGSQALGERIEVGLKAVCERPDIRDLKSMAAWEQCKDAAMTSANEQLARQGARVAAN